MKWSFKIARMLGIDVFLHASFLLVLAFIAVFIWFGAGQEAAATEMKATIRGLPVREAMLTDFRTLSADEPLEGALFQSGAGPHPHASAAR